MAGLGVGFFKQRVEKSVTAVLARKALPAGAADPTVTIT
jgi:hypothetical protein